MELYKIGPVTLGFQGFPKYVDWPFRDWKLDAYKISAGQPDVLVSYAPETVIPQGKLLEEQRFMTAKRQLWCEDGYLLWQQSQRDGGLLQYKITPQKITLLTDTTNTFGLAALEAMTFFIFECLLHKDVLTFHSCVVEHNGRGFLLAGASGVGKSTHARLWREHKNALILNSDRGSCYMQDGKWLTFGTPWCGTGGEQINRQVPVQAMVILQQADYNRVTPLQGQERLVDVMPQVFAGWDSAIQVKMITLLGDFLETIPVLRLECTPDARAVDALYDYLENLQ